MKKLTRSLIAVGVVLTFSVATFADIAAPKPSPKQGKMVLHTSLVIEPDSQARQARLQIDQESLRQILGSMENQPGTGAAAITTSPKQTIIAGISLFLAMSFGGVWLLRSHTSRGQKTVAVVLTASAFLGVAAILTKGNAGPPPALRWQPLAKNLTDGKATFGSVDIEIMPEGHGVKLIVPLPKKGERPAE